MNKMNKQTASIHFPFQQKDAYGALSMPVYHSVAYEFDNADIMAKAFCGQVDMPDYSRITNPTVIYFERKVKSLTDAEDVVAVTSGMAAISNTLLTLASAGKNIVTSRHLFGNSFLLLSSSLKRFGVEARFVDMTNLQEVEQNIDDNTCCIFFETITNPQMEVADIKELAAVAHRKGTVVVADTTMIPFTVFNAKAAGVDIEVLSSTKYISGGATSCGGLIINYGVEGFSNGLRKDVLMNFGAYMTPHVAYMMNLGMETLAVRYKAQSEAALELARRLEQHPAVAKVTYPGLESHPYHEVATRQFGTAPGAMLTIDLHNEQECFTFINSLKLVKRATNLFDNRTLAIHPYSTIFGPLSVEARKEMDVLPTTIRLSVGLEDVNDVHADLSQALDAVLNSNK
jgi:O-acetylhomoserine (thiol)-lyase